MKKVGTCKIKKFFILLTLLLITIALSIDVTIYCHLIKYKTKQKRFHIKTQIKN